MSLLGTLLIALAKVIGLIINMYTFIVTGAVIISWVRPDPYNPIVQFLHSATEPVFKKVRSILPPSFFKTGLDITPLLVIIILVFLETILTTTLMDWGIKLRMSSPHLP